MLSLSSPRRWLLAGIALVVYTALAAARYDGWLAKPITLGPPYLGQCTASGAAYHCASDTSTLKAVTAPIRLKARHDYVVTLRGKSLLADPVKVYVDFYGGKDYDAPAQKGIVFLRGGPVQTFVLRWPSDLPPEHALFRLSNADAADFVIESVRIMRLSSGLARVDDGLLTIALLLVLSALWQDRERLRAFRFPRPSVQVLRAAPTRALLFVATSIATLLLIRVSVMSAPMVFGDEMSYALLSASLGDSTVYLHNSLMVPLPNQLFFDLYHVATQCGDAMLGVARAMNAVLFALAAFPIFFLSRRYLPERHALALTVLILLLPNSAYTSFFMPESFYFPVFWFVAWAFVAFIDPDGRTRHAALAGFALAILSLVKPHGLTILLACNLVLLVALCAWRGERRRVALGWVALLLAFAATRGMFGIFNAPEAGGTWLDRTLGTYANTLTHTLQFSLDAQTLDYLRVAAINNVGSFLLLFGPALLLNLGWLLRRRASSEGAAEKALDRLQLFTLVMFGCLLVGTIKFTALVAGIEGAERIHQRYYDFAFGLLLLGACASLLAISQRGLRPRRRTLLALLPIAAIAFWYLTHEFQSLRPEIAHHPTLAALWTWRIYGVSFIPYAVFLSLVLMLWGPRSASRLYALCLALICVGGFLQTWHRGLLSQDPEAPDRAVLAVKSLYKPAQLEHGLIVAESAKPLHRTAFFLHNNAFVRVLPEGSVLDVTALARGAEWVLTYGHYEVAGDWGPRLRLPGEATLYEPRAQ
jgi:phosphoglycerol transferase